MDFKVRALDFLSIYVKQKGYSGKAAAQIKLIQGLLKALSVAHKDQHTILFDRIKSVLTLMAKQGSPQQVSSSATNPEESKATGQESNASECKVLLTEMMSMLLRQHKDPALQKAYSDCFILLTKHFYEKSEDDKATRDFLVFTYKELLKKFLQGRCAQTSGLNPRFFQSVFEQCPSLGWSLVKPILKCFLAKSPSKEEGGDEEMKEEDGVEGSRGNHQRLQAIEMYGILIKASQSEEQAMELMAQNLGLLSQVICRVVSTAETWQKQKVKKTGQCVGLFAKAAKVLIQKKQHDAHKEVIVQQGAKLIKQLEEACEKDKAMSNLKGKAKEIKAIVTSL